MDFKLHDLNVEIIQKKIKNIYLSVRPPATVKVSAPKKMSIESIQFFIISKLGWIQQQQKKLSNQLQNTSKKYIDEESHYFCGKRYWLRVVEHDSVPQVNLLHSFIVLQVRPGSNIAKKRAVLDAWYRKQLQEKVSHLIAQWEQIIGVAIARFTLRKMKTLWGSCSPRSRSIRINLELAKKPIQCLQYVIVHELVHLLEPSHNARFVALMDKFLPEWRLCREQLNELPVCYRY